MKKLLSLLFAFVMLVSVLIPASSAYANSMEKADTIQLNEALTFTIERSDEKISNYWVKFTCPESGVYEFVNSSLCNPNGLVYGYIFSDTKTQLDIMISDMSSGYFTMCRALEQGKDYYFCIKNEKGTYDGVVAVSKHVHNYSQTVTIPAICDEDATISTDGGIYMYCPGCKDYQLVQSYPPVVTVVLSSTVYTYNRKEKRPSAVLYDSFGNVIPAADYTISYEDNVFPGTATAYITLNSPSYIGEFVCYYTINPPKPKKVSSLKLKASSKRKMTISWAKDKSATGYEIQYSTSPKFYKSKTKTIRITKNSKTSTTISKLISRKRYYVRAKKYMVVNGITYYSAWSSPKNIKVK